MAAADFSEKGGEVQGDVLISPAFLRCMMAQEVGDGCVTKVEVKEGILGTRAGKRRPGRSTLERPARPRLGIRSGAFPRVKVGCHIQQGNSFRVAGRQEAYPTGQEWLLAGLRTICRGIRG